MGGPDFLHQLNRIGPDARRADVRPSVDRLALVPRSSRGHQRCRKEARPEYVDRLPKSANGSPSMHLRFALVLM